LDLSGSIPALVTPFKDGQVDTAALKQLVEFQILGGSSGILVCGTTGESATLSHEEHERVIETAVQAVKGRVKVIAGTGSNNTAEAVRLTAFANKAGADAALLIAPYYNKPTQEGLYQHFMAVAQAVDLPQIPYNIQGRTAVNVEPETLARLASQANIVAVKEASGSLEQMSRVRLLCGDKLALISGDDALTLPVMAIGGVGVMSVVANIAPRATADLVAKAAQGDYAGARAIHYALLPLVRALFTETNPAPVKAAMGLMGLCGASLRLPLVSIRPENLEKLRREMQAFGLLKG
jgi:4-hydroxy-tetrahydrodipicolinate synthase